MTKKLLSLSRKDFRIDTFRAGGKGGQGQNKRSSGVRVVHPASGAVGEGRDSRSRLQNQTNAFKRCVESDTFKKWLHVETSRALGQLTNAEQKVDESMDESNLITEIYIDGKWEEI